MRSPFTSKNITTIPIPGLEGQSATIRQLAGRHLEAAQQVAFREALSAFKALDPEAVKQLTTIRPEQARAALVADPLSNYDPATLIASAVQSWTLGDHAPTVDEAEDLEPDVRDGLAREVLRWAKPSLFRTAEEQEAAQKNA